MFEAKYRGQCAACGGSVNVGDPCAYSEGVVVHADCPEPVDILAPRSPICPRCFMETATNGTCGGCDE